MEGGNTTSLSTTFGVVVNVHGPNLHPNVLDCHICRKPPTNPVATSCGHVFCWPCICHLFQNEERETACASCGTIMVRDLNILPLYYDSGVTDIEASSNMILPRPRSPQVFFHHLDSMEGSGTYRSTVYNSWYGWLISQIEHELAYERTENEALITMTTMQANLQNEVNMLEEIHFQLIREQNQRIVESVRLELQVGQVTDMLPLEESDQAIVDLVQNEAPIDTLTFQFANNL